MAQKTSIEWTDSTWSPIRVRVRQMVEAFVDEKVLLQPLKPEGWKRTPSFSRSQSRGFAQLPATTGRYWWDVLQVSRNAPVTAIEANFKRLLQERHPDHGGSQEAMIELNLAHDLALKESRA